MDDPYRKATNCKQVANIRYRKCLVNDGIHNLQFHSWPNGLMPVKLILMLLHKIILNGKTFTLVWQLM